MTRSQSTRLVFPTQIFDNQLFLQKFSTQLSSRRQFLKNSKISNVKFFFSLFLENTLFVLKIHNSTLIFIVKCLLLFFSGCDKIDSILRKLLLVYFFFSFPFLVVSRNIFSSPSFAKQDKF